ncbi:hypothetical protein Tco_0007265 [Tanacetum coccineum]
MYQPSNLPILKKWGLRYMGHELETLLGPTRTNPSEKLYKMGHGPVSIIQIHKVKSDDRLQKRGGSHQFDLVGYEEYKEVVRQMYILKQQFKGFLYQLEGLHKGLFMTRFQSPSESIRDSWGRSYEWTIQFDDLYNNLRVFENDVKGSTASSSSTQNVAFVSENTRNPYDQSLRRRRRLCFDCLATAQDQNTEEEFAQETEDLLLQAGVAKTSSTNIVNTASTPISTNSPYDGLSFSDPTNPDLI